MLEVRQTEYGGRAYFATESIPRGVVVLCELPAVSTVYDDFRKEVCLYCFRYDRGNTLKVRVGTTSRACSEACRDSFLGLREGRPLQDLWDDVQRRRKGLGEEVDYDMLRFCGSAHAVRRTDRPRFDAVLALQDDHARTTAAERSSAAGVARALDQLLPDAAVDAASLVDAMMGRSKCNCFGIWEQAEGASFPESEMFGYALYPSASFFNHACRPNVDKVRVGREMRFLAAADIAAGTELTISYLGDRAHDDVRARQRALQSWGFSCLCALCREEENATHRVGAA